MPLATTAVLCLLLTPLPGRAVISVSWVAVDLQAQTEKPPDAASGPEAQRPAPSGDSEPQQTQPQGVKPDQGAPGEGGTAQEPSAAPQEPLQEPPQEPKTNSETPQEPAANPEQARPEPAAPAQQSSEPAKVPPVAQPSPVRKKPAAKKGGAAKTSSNRKSTAKKRLPPNPAKQTDNAAPKVVIRNGGTTDPKVELSRTLTQQQTNAQLQNTNRLLDAADANLKKVSGRQLSAAQQDVVKQIRAYMQQAKTAAGDGDVQQANNLATKARMLSDELVKQ